LASTFNAGLSGGNGRKDKPYSFDVAVELKLEISR
jgi:hypothetical protein